MTPAKQVEALMKKPTAVAFKATNSQGRPLHYPWADIVYEVGVVVMNPKGHDPTRSEPCSYGLNLAVMDYLRRIYDASFIRLFVVEFDTASKNVCIPFYSDGMFRVTQCKVIAEVTDVAAAFDPDWSYKGAH